MVNRTPQPTVAARPPTSPPMSSLRARTTWTLGPDCSGARVPLPLRIPAAVVVMAAVLSSSWGDFVKNYTKSVRVASPRSESSWNGGDSLVTAAPNRRSGESGSILRGALGSAQGHDRQRDQRHRTDRDHPPLLRQPDGDHAERDQGAPGIHQDHRADPAVASLEQSVVQVLLVRDEPPGAAQGPADVRPDG